MKPYVYSRARLVFVSFRGFSSSASLRKLPVPDARSKAVLQRCGTTRETLYQYLPYTKLGRVSPLPARRSAVAESVRGLQKVHYRNLNLVVEVARELPFVDEIGLSAATEKLKFVQLRQLRLRIGCARLLFQQLVSVMEKEFVSVVESYPRGSDEFVYVYGPTDLWGFPRT